ncbi:MAG TPA: DivIVA domain-containing protein [Candidatus Hydrogenedens sp.]|nr:DivIVA domain-containing protein [Candidatus Hydrogenedens sp.]
MRKDKVISEVLGAETVLTPSEIYAQRFPKSIVGGYSPEAVDEFLHRVADTVELLIEHIKELKDKVDEQTKLIETYRREESVLHSALNSAQKLNEDILESAQRQAEAIIAEAQTRAQQMPLRLEQEIQQLIHLRDRFHQEIKTSLLAFQSMLSEFEATQVKTLSPENRAEALSEIRKTLDQALSTEFDLDSLIDKKKNQEDNNE